MSSRRLAFAALVVLVATAAADAVWGVGVRYVLAPADADDAAAGFVPGDDPARRQQMAANARRAYEACYTLDRVADAYLRHLERWCGAA